MSAWPIDRVGRQRRETGGGRVLSVGGIGTRRITLSCSLTSSTAWGKRVISLRGTGLEGSRNHRSLLPSRPVSVSMVRLVSREMRTVASKGIWKAVPGNGGEGG